MHHVLALFQEGGEEIHVFRDVDLRGAGVGAFAHAPVKFVKGDRLAQVVGVLCTVKGIVKADVTDADALKVLLGQVGGGAAAQNILAHNSHPFARKLLYNHTVSVTAAPFFFKLPCRPSLYETKRRA